MKRKLTLLLLGCILLVLAAVLMTGYLRVGGSIPSVVAKSSPSSRGLLLEGKISASRTLMSRNVSVKTSRGLMTTAPPPPKLEDLLQKSTSKLYCSSRTRSSYNSIAKVAGIGCDQCTGYILVLSFREQQTKASDNLFDLQCWARTLYVNIVEPFVEKSHLVVPLPINSSQQLFRFRDIFDSGVWKLLSAQHKFAPLVPLDEFYEKAPRELIVVQFKYLTFKLMMKQREANETVLPHFAVDGNYKEGCETSPELTARVEYLRRVHNFSVIREVCINFANGDELTLHQFNHHLYAGIDSKSVTVLMEEWRGLSSQEGGRRVVLSNACSSVHVKSMTYTWPSQRLVCDSKRYKQKFFFGEDYVSVMVRTEKVGRLNSSPEFMSACLNKTLRQWRTLKATTGLKRTFLAMDIGQYGSYSLVEKNSGKYYPLLHLYTYFIKELFGKDATIESWEASFESISPRQDLGYIGSLQKTIAAQGKCMVLTGGGSFQRHTKIIHDRTANRKQTCVQIIQKCSRGLDI